MTVAAYFVRRSYYVESIDFEPPKGIDLVFKCKSGNKYAVQVAEHIESEEDLGKETLEDFIGASEDLNIPSARRMLILFDCPLSDQEIEDFLKADEIGQVITGSDIGKKNIDWQECWDQITDPPILDTLLF